VHAPLISRLSSTYTNAGITIGQLCRQTGHYSSQARYRYGISENAGCWSLVSNAILVWNTLQVAKIVEALRESGNAVLDGDLAHVSPLMHRHEIPNGNYHFSRANEEDNML
jgi:hypothetical protein